MQKLVIDGKEISVKLDFMDLEHILIDVTCFSDEVTNYIASGIRYMELEGVTSNGKIIKGKFQILEHINNTFIVKSIHG